MNSLPAKLAASLLINRSVYIISDEFKEEKLDGIDLKKEYELIKQKKSKLSATLRKLVVYRYEQEAKT